ncbi:hypothetical protein G6F59_017398 [Rhizopus arrhizus]|nr:hypothetical protein G6F59_017398 [Rhizopus arrhizus]
MSQFESSAFPTSYIPTAAAPVTVTDYAASTAGLITMGQAPDIGASLTWTGSYTYEYEDDAPTLADRTVISQYANSPTRRQLIRNMDEYINPDADFDAFYDYDCRRWEDAHDTGERDVPGIQRGVELAAV